MMDEVVSSYKKRCKAMVDAGVEDPDSQEGINFCTEQCPYDYCVVFEHSESARQLERKGRIALAKELKAHGVSLYDIALIVRKSEHTVRGYLKK